MKKFIKGTIGVVMSVCVALSGTACYAKKGKNGRGRPPVTKDAMVYCPAVDPDEEKLANLQWNVETLISRGGDVASCSVLRDKLIVIEDSDVLIHKFSEFFMDVIKNKKSAKSVYDGTILFLSILRRLPRSCDRNLYFRVALLTLDICATRGDDMYAKWYKLLEPGVRKIPADIGNGFKKFKKKWHSDWSSLLEDKHASCLAAADIEGWLSGTATEKQIDFLIDQIMSQSPLFVAGCEAANAIASMPKMPSPSDIDKAVTAVKKYEKAINKSTRYETPEYIRERRSELKGMQRDVEQRQKILKEVLSEVAKIESSTKAAIDTMLSKRSWESVAAAKTAVDHYHEWVLGFGKEGKVCERQFRDLIDWVENYLEFIHPHMVAADEAISQLSRESSDELFGVALKAQEKFRKALDEHRPTSCLSECMRALSSLCLSERYGIVSPIIQPEITEDFKSMERHLDENQRLIADLKKEHDIWVEYKRVESERRQKLSEWKSRVDANRQSKDEKKRCKVERAESPKEIVPSDIVFFHSSENTDPLKFLTENRRHIDEWNTWYSNALKGVIVGDKMDLHSIAIYQNETGRDLGIHKEDGHPVVYEYRGGGAARNTPQGFRIVFYVEEVSNRIVILYVREPFGETHDNPWTTLQMKPDWTYEHVDTISK